jgi:hypothetical protein
MASSSSNSLTTTSPLGFFVTEKLVKGNFILWQAQVLPAIRGARLTCYLDGSTEAPNQEVSVKRGDTNVIEANQDYEDWVAQDQKVLSFLISSFSRDVQPHVVSAKRAVELWVIL